MAEKTIYNGRPNSTTKLFDFMDEAHIIREYLEGASSRSLALKYHCSKGAILRTLKRYDIPLRRRVYASLPPEEQLLRRRERSAKYHASDKGRKKVKEWRKIWSKTQVGISSLRNSDLKERHGITLDQWEEMFAAQGKVCAACGSDNPRSQKGWHTHHVDTAEGAHRVDGILCHPCNISAGDGSQERVEQLRRLADWLESFL